MKTFEGKVAVITGAASGIGRGLTERCLAEGMHVVMADIEEDVLNKTADALRAEGNNSIVTVKTDVSVLAEIENLKQVALDSFGAVHLLFNNAGVGGGGNAWDASIRGIYFLPAKLQLGDVLSAVGLSLGLSFVVTIFPARRAARMNPVEALRYE